MRRLRAAAGMAVLAVATGLVLPAGADPIKPPLPEPGMLEPIAAGQCLPETAYESHVWYWSYVRAKVCKRIRFSYGPIVVRPGQNDVLVGPVTLEKPAYGGYWTRFKPDLVDATGKPPSINDVHLHHANWITPMHGIMLATGEEKTIATWPEGYGVPTPLTDPWIFAYMVHNTGASPMTVYITWDMDFISDADVPVLKAREGYDLKPVYPIWLDVQGGSFPGKEVRTGSNPVFNVMRGYGHLDPETGTDVCVWPNENCAKYDVYGDVTAQQGKPVEQEVLGTDRSAPSRGGTLIGLGGHLHPGGVRDEVALVRNGVEKEIFVSDAVYWDREDPSKAGGLDVANSWDFSMTVNGASLGWKVGFKPGDNIRIRAVQENRFASWYENMGIVMAFYAPEDHPVDEAACAAAVADPTNVDKRKGFMHCPALDPFTDAYEADKGLPTTARWPQGFGADWAQPPGSCTPDPLGRDGAKNLCLRGQVTHGHLDEAGDFGGCPPRGCRPLTDKRGDFVTDIPMASFLYGQADFATIDQTGIPRVRLGEKVRFWNVDTAADIWHTITGCALPCTGSTGLDYPTADATDAVTGEPVDFDSAEIGYGISLSPAKSHLDRSDWSLQKKIESGLFWDFDPQAERLNPGVYTFWCRVHPFMRGAIEVVGT